MTTKREREAFLRGYRLAHVRMTKELHSAKARFDDEIEDIAQEVAEVRAELQSLRAPQPAHPLY